MAALTRKTEVTKLITVTLGKIQESKHAKCGLNLRKSLLVASVLHKARNIYVSDLKSRVVVNGNSCHKRTSDASSNDDGDDNIIDDEKKDARSSNSRSPVIPPKVVRRFSSQRSMSMIEEEPSAVEDVVDMDSNSRIVSNNNGYDDQEEEQLVADDERNQKSFTQLLSIKNNTTTNFKCSSQTESENNGGDESRMEDIILDNLASISEGECDASLLTTDKENNPPIPKQQPLPTAVLSPSSCGRCLKRRASTTTDYSDNNTDTEYSSNNDPYHQSTPFYVPMKRSRSNSSVDCTPCESSEDTSSSNKPLPMDTTQINNLVSKFSQSFQDFASTHDATSSAYETSTEINTFALCRESIALTA